MCAGTILKLIDQGKKVGIVDLTAGDLGSRGTPELRLKESRDSAEVLGLHARENLGFRDGFFTVDEAHQMPIIKAVRRYRPEVVIANAPEDRHPDHGRASKLVRDAAFLSGLKMIKTEEGGKSQEHWRPKRLFYYIQDYALTPDFVIDIGAYMDKKMEAIKAFRSQFYDPDSKEPETYISTEAFLHFLEARARNVGHMVGIPFGEGFISETPLHVSSFMDLI